MLVSKTKCTYILFVGKGGNEHYFLKLDIICSKFWWTKKRSGAVQIFIDLFRSLLYPSI